MQIERMIRRFREAGLKITPQRVAIFEYLYTTTSHPTVDDIYAYITGRFPSVSLTTVYNTLQTMVGLGEIEEIAISHERRNFDPDTRPHSHIMCVKCKRIEDIYTDNLSENCLPESVRKRYRILGQRIYFYGLCSRCVAEK
ncbi:MAG: transcriptional repressor [bacterium]|nr:transcriptional repressor [bacterium]